MPKIIIKKKQDAEEQCNVVVSPSSSLSPSFKLKSTSKLKPSTSKLLPEAISINNYALLLDNDFDFKVVYLKNIHLNIETKFTFI